MLSFQTLSDADIGKIYDSTPFYRSNSENRKTFKNDLQYLDQQYLIPFPSSLIVQGYELSNLNDGDGRVIMPK